MDFRSRQQLKQALESHRRSLEGLESALIEFEETLNQPEQRSSVRPLVQQRSTSRGLIELVRN